MNFGENLKKVRTKKNLTLQDLARLSGVSISMLSQIEREAKTPTLRIALKIADALEVSITDLIGQTNKLPVTVINRTEQKYIQDPQSGVIWHILSPSFPSNHLQFYRIIIPPHQSLGVFGPHRPGTEEYTVVHQGCLKIILEDSQVLTLEEGDSVAYNGNQRHELINPGGSETILYLVVELSIAK